MVLIPQDTTDIDQSHRKKRDELGYLSTENSQGLYLHPSIAFTPEGCFLGTTDVHLWIRKELGSRDERKKKPLEDKETFCWLRGYEVANEIVKASPNMVIVSISDREGDIYDVLEKLLNENHKAFWLIRCKYDRVVLDEESGSKKIY